MARLRLFGPAREAAGTSDALVPGRQRRRRRGRGEGAVRRAVLRCSRRVPRVWVNGDEAAPDTPVGDDDEVAVIPPVSGGCA